MKMRPNQNKTKARKDEEDEEVGGEGDQRNGTPATWR